MEENKPKINWTSESTQPMVPQANEPQDIDENQLPKRYAQFDTTSGKQQSTPEPTRYVEFDDKAILGQTGYVEDNEPFDVIELPSKGYFYPNRKTHVRVGYLTAADENILTSPNLIQSGKVIEVLLRKKIKDKDIDIKNLLPGDRTAIMLFLRATGYGKDYPISLIDPLTGDEFEYVVDLSSLQVKEITEMPDANGEFNFELPRSKKQIKIKLLSPEEEKNITEVDEKRKLAYGEDYISNRLTMRLEKAIVEIDGNRDKSFIANFIQSMPAFDSLSVRSHLIKVEPGVDTNIKVKAPSGEIVQTNIPFGPNFFWPKL